MKCELRESLPASITANRRSRRRVHVRTNFLEQLLAEWYEHLGYFLRRNVKIEKLAQGGYGGELDIIGINLKRRHVVHIECSHDASSWSERTIRFRKKFQLGRKAIPTLFEGYDIDQGQIEQIAVLGVPSDGTNLMLDGVRTVVVSDLLGEIARAFASRSLASNIIPETMPILRTIHFATAYRNVFVEAWQSQSA